MGAESRQQQQRPSSGVKIVDLRQDNIINQPTTVHCEKDVKCWSALRTAASFLVAPSSCYCSTSRQAARCGGDCCSSWSWLWWRRQAAPPAAAAAAVHDSALASSGVGGGSRRSVVTGTIFGQRKGKVSVCVQEDPRGSPVLLLELAMPTFLLVKEMSSGLLRIALECESSQQEAARKPLYAEPVWTMFCNGRKVGFALRRQCSESDRAILGLMQSISMGAGVIPLEPKGSHGSEQDDDLMYMRATYERVVGSQDSESLHMINPDGSPGQELSIFLMRS